MSKLTKSQTGKVLAAIEQHNKFKSSYFWSPPSTASGRRQMEKVNTWGVRFKHQGREYQYSSNVDVSCKNVYYQGVFAVDGEIKNVSLFKKLLEGKK